MSSDSEPVHSDEVFLCQVAWDTLGFWLKSSIQVSFRYTVRVGGNFQLVDHTSQL